MADTNKLKLGPGFTDVTVSRHILALVLVFLWYLLKITQIDPLTM